jgi:hypothetical protein
MECIRRKPESRNGSHSSIEDISHSSSHPKDVVEIKGFINKIVADIRKLCVYRADNQIKWMNERPSGKSAYQPSEVRIYRFLFPKIDCFVPSPSSYITEFVYANGFFRTSGDVILLIAPARM